MVRLLWVDSKCNHVYSYKREAEADFNTHRGEDYVKTEAGIRVMQSEAKEDQ